MTDESRDDTATEELATQAPMSPAERHRILVEWNNTERDYPRHLLMHQLIEAQVERTPDDCAIIFEGQRTTYCELNERANRLARYIGTQGAEPGALVGVYMERSTDMVVALLAILKSGAGYLPLDPNYPPDRLAYMAEDASVDLVLTQQSLHSHAQSFGATAICVDQLAQEALEEFPGENLDGFNIDPAQSVAYIIYTSGSTGKPKGIQVTHQNAVNFLCAMEESPGLNADDVLAAVSTISFDIHVLELYLTLSVGATVLLVSDAVRTDGAKLCQLLQQQPVTVMQATPATWRLLFSAGWFGRAGLKALYGAEAMPKEMLQKLIGCTGSVWNLYGPTESTVWCTVKHMTNPDERSVIGRPIANKRIYIVDEQLQPVAVGETGELCVAGDGITLGYINKPELTAEVFVDDPFASQPGETLYRSGDLAKYRDDGEIILLGRADHQVKVRGFRIELGEIETALRALPTISDAVVTAKQIGEGDNRLVAHIITSTDDELSPSALRDELGAKLPEYMLPTFFIKIDELPLTPSGKLDRNALPDINESDAALVDAAEEPTSETERCVMEIWREALEIPSVSPSQTLFEQGGTSLMVMHIAIQTEKELGVRLSPNVFTKHSLREIAKLCTEKQAGSKNSKPGFFQKLFGSK